MIYSPEGRGKLLRNGPIYTSVSLRKTRTLLRAVHTRGESPPELGLVQPLFKDAPSGTAPVSRYFHNSTSNFRAQATIPIRLMRLLL